jgi:hypothetical protein
MPKNNEGKIDILCLDNKASVEEEGPLEIDDQ